MEIKVKYRNGKLLSNNKDIILNNVANLHEITKNDPMALSTKLFFGIVKASDGEMKIFPIIPLRSLHDNDVIYLYIWDKYTRHWLCLDRFTETRTIFDSYKECMGFYMKIEYGVSDTEESRKSIADELLDEVEEKSREDVERNNFEELCERAKKFEEYRKLTAEIAKTKDELKNADRDFNIADEECNKSYAEFDKIRRELDRKTAIRDEAKKVMEECEKKLEEMDNRRTELDNEIKANSCDVSAFWDAFLRQCFDE